MPESPPHLDYNNPACAGAAAEMLRRHDLGEPEANITSAVRDFLIATRLARSDEIVEEDPPAQGSRRAVDLAAPRHLHRVQAQDRLHRRPRPQPRVRRAARRLPGPVAEAGPSPHGHPHRREALAPALAQRRARQGRAALRLHPGRPGQVVHPPRLAPRPRPLRGGGQAALP